MLKRGLSLGGVSNETCSIQTSAGLWSLWSVFNCVGTLRKVTKQEYLHFITHQMCVQKGHQEKLLLIRWIFGNVHYLWFWNFSKGCVGLLTPGSPGI